MLELFQAIDVNALADGLAAGGIMDLVNKARQFIIGPAFILILGFLGIKILVSGEMRKGATLLIIGLIGGIFIYAPDLFKNTATGLGQNNSDLSF